MPVGLFRARRLGPGPPGCVSTSPPAPGASPSAGPAPGCQPPSPDAACGFRHTAAGQRCPDAPWVKKMHTRHVPRSARGDSRFEQNYTGDLDHRKNLTANAKITVKSLFIFIFHSLRGNGNQGMREDFYAWRCRTNKCDIGHLVVSLC